MPVGRLYFYGASSNFFNTQKAGFPAFLFFGVIFMNNIVRKIKPSEIKVVVNFIGKNDNNHLRKVAALLAKGAVKSFVENRIDKNN